MIMKVKEPIAEEYKRCRPGQLVFTYFHFASSEELTHAMIESGAICLAYETVETKDRQLPLLIPMSEVAGRMAIQQGAKYLEKPVRGRGVLLGGVPGVPPGRVLVLGGGIVGTQAAKMAAGLGAAVTILDVNLSRLRYLSDIMPANVVTMFGFLGFFGALMTGIGLYTLVSLNIVKRMKEIGVRKVLGASLGNIAGVINKEFVINMLFSMVVGGALGYGLTFWLMQSIWAYYLAINAVTIIISVTAMVFIAISAVGYKTVATASLNPTKTLRDE
jgi:hypothetical protein